MANGTPLLSTLIVMFLAVVLCRVSLLLYRRELLKSRDVGIVEEKVRRWWHWGGGLIVLIGLVGMLVYVLLSGVDVVGPILDSIMLGSIYAILGIGLTLTYAVVKLPNFAHGELATIGGYAMFLTNTLLGYPLPLAFIIAAVAGAGLGLVQHVIVYRPLINRRAKIVQIMIGSFAVSLILRSLFWVSAAYYNITQYHPIAASAVRQITIPFTTIMLFDCKGICAFGNSGITDLFFWVLVTSIPLIIATHLLLTRTRFGKSMRAVADNVELAQITGINVEHIRQVTWLLTGALAGIGGAFLAIDFGAWPELGWTYVLRVFAAVTLGGLVSVYGTIVGGLIVGFGEIWVTDVGSNFGLSSYFQPFIVFLIIVLVLLIRPSGLIGLKLPKLGMPKIRRKKSSTSQLSPLIEGQTGTRS